MKNYRKVLLGMILIFSFWNTLLYLQMIVSAYNNDGIWIISFNQYGEMLAEIIMWSIELLSIFMFILSGFYERREFKS